MSFRRILLPAVALLGLGACSVYAPMRGAAPYIRERNQAELTASTYLNSRWEASAAYSPLRYVLVRGAVSGGRRSGQGDTAYFRSRQYEAALGGYWPISRTFVAGGLLGYGRAHTSRGFWQAPFLFSGGQLYRYEANYHRHFGELYAYAENDWGRVGVAYRLNRVRFDSFRYIGQLRPVDRTLRHEATALAGFHGREGTRWRGLGMEVALGLSEVPRARADNPSYYDSSVTRQGVLFSTLTLQLFPQYLFQRY